MKINKKRLLSLIVLISIIIIILIFVIVKLSKTNEEAPVLEAERKSYLYYEENPAQIVNGKKPEKTGIVNIFCSIDECVKNYLAMLQTNDSEVIISYLNNDFINNNGITKQNVFTKLKKYNKDSYITLDMYELDGRKYYEYYIKGIVDNNYVYFVVDTDTSSGTFDIFPINEEKYKQYLEKVAQTDETKEKTIANKTYNFYRKYNLNEEEFCRLYYTNYIKLMLTDAQEAFNKLNKEYKQEKFSNLDAFKQYIKENQKKLELIYNVETADSTNFESHEKYYDYITNNSKYSMKNYAVHNYNTYIQYVCGNITGTNYIFNAKRALDYEVFLDSYTICESTYTESYNKATDENKVAMNLERIRGALNNKDYKFVYDRLDDTFKKKNYNDLNKFKEFIQKNLFEYNTFEYKRVKKEGDLYIGEIYIKDATEEDKTIRAYTIIMRLDEGTNFVMSFSVN